MEYKQVLVQIEERNRLLEANELERKDAISIMAGFVNNVRIIIH